MNVGGQIAAVPAETVAAATAETVETTNLGTEAAVDPEVEKTTERHHRHAPTAAVAPLLGLALALLPAVSILLHALPHAMSRLL